MMNFNPLFIGQVNTAGTISSSATKLGKSSYLFSDIIKVILEDEPALQVSQDSTVTDLTGTNILNLSNLFQDIPETTHFTHAKLTTDFIELSPDSLQQVTETDETESLVQNEFELNKNDLQQLLLSLAGYSTESEVKITPSETESINNIVNTASNLGEDETLSLQVEGLDEQIQIEIKKTQDPSKEFTAKFLFASTELQKDSDIPTATIVKDNKITAYTNQANVLSDTIVDGLPTSPDGKIPVDFKASSDVQPLTDVKQNTKVEEPITSTSKTVEAPVIKQNYPEQSKPTTENEIKSGPNNSPVLNDLKKENNKSIDSVRKNTVQVNFETENLTKEFKTEIKIDSSVPEQKEFKQNVTPEKIFQSGIVKQNSTDDKLTGKNTQPENVKRVQHSDLQKVVRLTLNNSEQVNLRDVLANINKAEVKLPANKQTQDFSSTKLEQNQVRLYSKISLDETNISKPEIKLAKNILAVKEDSFEKLSGLNKQVLAGKTVAKTETNKKSSDTLVNKNDMSKNHTKVEEGFKEFQHVDEEIRITNDDKKFAEIHKPEKYSVESKLNIKNVQNESNEISKNKFTVEEKSQADILQQPVKQFGEVKQNKHSLNAGFNKIASSKIITDENKIPEIQTSVKEPVEIKQSNKNLQVESNNNDEKNLKLNSTPEEASLNNNGEGKNSNQFYQDQKNTASVPTPNIKADKPVVESQDKPVSEQASGEIKLDMDQKTVIKESTVLAKEKIITETRHINEDVKTIRSSEIVKEISNFVKSGNTQTVTFKVVPENLGKIQVSLDVTDQVAKATIEVETETVKQIVQSNIETLKQSLTQNGITVNAINVSLTGNQQKHNRPVDIKKKFDEDRKDNKIETENDTLVRKNLGYNTYEYLV